MKLKEYLEKQNKSFIKSFKDPVNFPVAIKDPEQFKYIEYPNYFWDESTRKNAFIREIKSNNKKDIEFYEYWVKTKYTGYRKAFIRFLETYYDVGLTYKNKQVFNVDHILNRAFAKHHSICYIRLALIPSEHNKAYGRTLEKIFSTEKENYNCKDKHIYNFDYLMLLKLLGIEIPKNKEDLKRISKELVNIGCYTKDEEQFQLECMTKNFFEYFKLVK